MMNAAAARDIARAKNLNTFLYTKERIDTHRIRIMGEVMVCINQKAMKGCYETTYTFAEENLSALEYTQKRLEEMDFCVIPQLRSIVISWQ